MIRLFGSYRHTELPGIQMPKNNFCKNSVRFTVSLRNKINVTGIFIIYFAFARSLATACKEEVQHKGPAVAYRPQSSPPQMLLLYVAYFRISLLLFCK